MLELQKRNQDQDKALPKGYREIKGSGGTRTQVLIKSAELSAKHVMCLLKLIFVADRFFFLLKSTKSYKYLKCTVSRFHPNSIEW